MEKPIEIVHPEVTEENAALVMFGLLHSFKEIAEKYPDLVGNVDLFVRADAWAILSDAIEDPHCAADGYLHSVRIPGLRFGYASLDGLHVPEDIQKKIFEYGQRNPSLRSKVLHTVTKLREIGGTRAEVAIDFEDTGM